MSNFIIYENCYYCGSPIRHQIIDVDSLGKEIQLPYCSDICRNKDPESYNLIQQTISENIEYNKEGGKYNFFIKQVKNDPHLNKIVEKKKDNDSHFPNYDADIYKKSSRNYSLIISYSIGIIFIFILAFALNNNEDYSSGTQKAFIRIFVVVLLALFKLLWEEIKN